MKNLTPILILASAVAGPAIAGPRDVVVTHDLDVPTATLLVTRADFASTHARTMLDRRIRSAIETVCGSYASIETDQTPALDNCWSDARRQADSQLDVAIAQGSSQVKITSR